VQLTLGAKLKLNAADYMAGIGSQTATPPKGRLPQGRWKHCSDRSTSRTPVRKKMHLGLIDLEDDEGDHIRDHDPEEACEAQPEGVVHTRPDQGLRHKPTNHFNP